MSRGLPVRPFPIFLSGALDTKTDPRLVPSGSMLEIENMFYLRTGELRLRNGFAQLSNSVGLIAELCGLWADARGKVLTVGKSFQIGQGSFLATQRYDSVAATWNRDSAFDVIYPAVTAERLTGSGSETSTLAAGGATSPSLPQDGDVAYNGTYDLHTWIDPNQAAGIASQRYAVRQSDAVVSQDSTTLGDMLQPPVACTVPTGGKMAIVYALSANNVRVQTLQSNGATDTATTVGAGLLDPAAPWIDARPLPGTSSIIIAYRAGAGGVTVLVFNVATNAVTVGPVNIAAADSSQALGFMFDASATGSAFLVTAGGTAGVVCRTLNPATLGVTTTTVIDAAATAGVRQVTGHTNGSATTYKVYWDVLAGGAALWKSKIRRADVTAGVPALRDHLYDVSLYSRSFLGNDGRYYLLTSYDGTPPTLMLFYAHQQQASSPTLPSGTPLCVLFPQSSTGRRFAQSSLTSAFTDASGRSVLSAGRRATGSTYSQERVAFTFGGRVVSRELGGLILSSGGVIMQSDGVETKWAAQVNPPEAITAVSAAGGAMTNGKTYSYTAVLADADALGNRIRSARSVPVSITLTTPGHGSATLTLQNPHTTGRLFRNQAQEIYRAGPAEDGNVNYNKVGEVYTNPLTPGTTLTFLDTMSDAVALTGESLYSTGNVLENFATPSTKLIEVCNQRLWVASAETPDELWPSKQFKPGTGVNFNSLLSFRVTGDGYGKITALAAMDGRLIVFKSSAIYAISGNGPNDLGQGSFNPPQAASLANGTTNPASVVATPDGVMFQSTKGGGLWLLDRGLGLTYAGAGVEQYTLSASIVGASLATGTTQVRFVLSDGRCLVLDYSKKTPTSPAGSWSTFLLRVQGSTVVTCADVPTGWCYGCADGRVYQETPGVFSDVNSVSTIAIIPAVTFPILAVGGINGFARLYAVNILGEYVGDHTLSAALTVDYDLVATARTLAVTAATGAFQLELKPTTQKGTAYRLRLTSAHAAGSGAFRLSAVTLWAGIKRGGSIPDTKRIP